MDGLLGKIVLPGEQIATKDSLYMQGHGTYLEDGAIYSSLAGLILKTQNLIQVIPLKQSYKGEVGDLVVGRVKQVDHKRWVVEIGGQQDAIMKLNSV